MGKIKKERKVQRDNPIQNNNSNSNNTNNEITIPIPIFDKMDSPDSEEREFAFRALSNLVFEEEKALKLLTTPEQLRKVVSHIVDPEILVRVACIGTLRNISLCDEKICETMMKEDVLTPLFATLSQSLTVLQTGEGSNGIGNLGMGEIRHGLLHSQVLQDLITQCVAVLWHLCETSEVALMKVSKSGVLPSFFQLFKPPYPSYDLFLTTLQFFNVFTDQNSTALDSLHLGPQNPRDFFMSIVSDVSLNNRIRVLASGILYNLSTPETRLSVVGAIGNLLMHAIDLDTIAGFVFFDNLLTEVANLEKNHSISEKEKEEKRGLVFKQMSDFLENIKAQQLSLELISNICTSPDTENDDIMDEKINENYDDEEMEGTLIEDSGEDDILSKQIASSGLFQKILAKVSPQPIDIKSIVGKNESLKDHLESWFEVQKRAFVAISNMLLSISVESLGGFSLIWGTLFKVCEDKYVSIRNSGVSIASSSSSPIPFIDKTQTGNIECLETVTSALWTLLRKTSVDKRNVDLLDTSTNGILTLASPPIISDEIQTNSIGILGIIGQRVSHPLSMQIGTVLLTPITNTHSPVFIICECLNSIFDVFAETDKNEVVKNLNLIHVLSLFLPKWRDRLKSERKTLKRDEWDHLDESRINLARFIKYKQKQL